MGEHGNNGKAAWVNVQPGLLGVLFFSNLGFWYHGIHHANPGIHYLELPARARDQAFRHRRDFIYRKGYGRYFFSGTSGDIKFEEESKIESQTKKRSSVGR